MIAGTGRAYFLSIPAGTAAEAILCLHGRGTSPSWQALLSGMDRLAKDRGAPIVFPRGSVSVHRHGYTWDLDADIRTSAP